MPRGRADARAERPRPEPLNRAKRLLPHQGQLPARLPGCGPIAVVYPEGTWYHGLTAERIPLFVEQHLVKGEPVREWVFAENPASERNPPGNPAGRPFVSDT